jgi:hypothetical protein
VKFSHILNPETNRTLCPIKYYIGFDILTAVDTRLFIIFCDVVTSSMIVAYRYSEEKPFPSSGP